MSTPTFEICFITPYRLTLQGHLANYIKSVYAGASQRQICFYVLGSRDNPPDLGTPFPVHCIFRDLSWDHQVRSTALDKIWGPLTDNVNFYRDMVKAIPNFLAPSQLFFIDSFDVGIAMGLALWLYKSRRRMNTNFVLMLRLGYFHSVQNRWSYYAPVLRLALRLLERISGPPYIHLVTDSEQLAVSYRSLTHLPITVLPIPHTRQVFPPPRVKSGSSINMTTLGSIGRTKGFGVLVDAIQVLYRWEQLSGLFFTLHCHSDCVTQDQLSWLSVLRNLPPANIRIIEESLDEEEYYRLLSETDMVLLPYSKDKYGTDTSGVFTEALAAGKPVVVTEGTWMSAQLEQYSAGVTCRDQDPEDLARAICEARDNYPHLAAQAQARRAAWMAYHNPENFIDELLNVVNRSEGRI